jgi:hypothetical protein
MSYDKKTILNYIQSNERLRKEFNRNILKNLTLNSEIYFNVEDDNFNDDYSGIKLLNSSDIIAIKANKVKTIKSFLKVLSL